MLCGIYYMYSLIRWQCRTIYIYEHSCAKKFKHCQLIVIYGNVPTVCVRKCHTHATHKSDGSFDGIMTISCVPSFIIQSVISESSYSSFYITCRLESFWKCFGIYCQIIEPFSPLISARNAKQAW